VQADRRLTAARAALDHDQTRVGLGDELELPWIDQGGDRLQMPIFSSVVRADAKLARAVMMIGAQRAALASRELQAGTAAQPLAAALTHEDTLWGDDAAQASIDDGQAPTCDNHPLDVALAEGLLVGVTLVIAVVEPAHRGVAPVDDAYSCTGIDVRGPPDQDFAVSLLLSQHHATEVRRASVDVTCGGLTLARGQVLQPFHLLEQRGYVFQASLGDLIPEIDELSIVVDQPPRTLRRRTPLHVRHDPIETLLLIAHDGDEFGVISLVGGEGRGWIGGELGGALGL
jgi:hypothetical protein